MTNIVIYARYSSEKQTEQSIEGQLRVCHEFAQKKGFNVIHEYIDRALTGTNDNRPSFQQMIADSAKQTFDYVLVYKLDRFSRNKYDNAVYKHKLQLNGVKVISATEPISNTPEGALMEGLLEMFAEMYIKDLSEKVKRGMKESVLKGNFIGGRVLFGYRVENKKVIKNEEQSKIVKKIYKDYVGGKSKKQIIEELNQLNIKTNKNSKFTLQSLQNMLTNEKYIGVYKSKLGNNSDYYPAIISEELFYAVQEKLKFNKKYKHTRNVENYILKGKVFCGYCGSPLVGASGTARDGSKRCYYACSNKRRHHSCSKNNERKDALENEVFNIITKKVLSKDAIEEITNNIITYHNSKSGNLEIKELEDKILKIEKKFDEITKQIIDAKNQNIISRLNKYADELTLEQEVYKTQLNKLKLVANLSFNQNDVIAYLQMFVSQHENEDIISYRQRIIDVFVNAVYVFDGRIDIYFNLFSKQSPITYDQVSNGSSIKPSGLPIETLSNPYKIGRQCLSFNLINFANRYQKAKFAFDKIC